MEQLTEYNDSEFENYGIFDYFIYFDTETNTYIRIDNIEEIQNYKQCIIYFKIPKDYSKNEYFKNLTYKITYDIFPWTAYLKLNNDLVKCKINTKETAWYHWINHGIKEERTYTCINNTNLHQGRFGNIFFVNIYLSFMSKKYNLKCYYKHEKIFNSLGIYFHKGKQMYDTNCLITDNNFLYILKNKDLEPCNLILKNAWFQTKEYCLILKSYFEREKIRNLIMNKNMFQSRYKNNNDLFIHLRLGDVTDITETKQYYYEYLLETIKYDKGFISTDSPNNPFFKQLVSKYKLDVIDYDITETIMFGSTCNNIILSGGTFSWLIAFLAFYSEYIYYTEFKNQWYGDIFSFTNWIKI